MENENEQSSGQPVSVETAETVTGVTSNPPSNPPSSLSATTEAKDIEETVKKVETEIEDVEGLAKKIQAHGGDVFYVTPNQFAQLKKAGLTDEVGGIKRLKTGKTLQLD